MKTNKIIMKIMRIIIKKKKIKMNHNINNNMKKMTIIRMKIMIKNINRMIMNNKMKSIINSRYNRMAKNIIMRKISNILHKIII
jgi:hypothetical protein